MKILHSVAFILVIVGGLNWLLHAFNYNVVDMVFGAGTTLAKAVYVLVGLSAVYLVFTHKNDCKNCMGMGQSGTM